LHMNQVMALAARRRPARPALSDPRSVTSTKGKFNDPILLSPVSLGRSHALIQSVASQVWMPRHRPSTLPRGTEGHLYAI
jgi:hypothetical protein